MSSEEIVVDVRGLSKCYEIYSTPRDRLKQLLLPNLQKMVNRAGVSLGVLKQHPPHNYFREFWALRDISFQIKRGEAFGIIGRNGGGKSTLLQILAGTLAPTTGEVNVNGRIAALLELGSGFNPEFTGRENVFLNGRILGLSQKEIEARYDQIIEFAGIGDFIDQPVKTYSSGMFVRLAFAVQAHIDASIVIIDEALAVGDVFFRQKCYARLQQLRDSGAAILLVSHAMTEIEQYCDRAILLDQGYPRFIGPAPQATKHYYLLNQAAAPKPPQIQNEPQKSTLLQSIVQDAVDIKRPVANAFFDLSDKTQVSNGLAQCVGIALCDAMGEPCSSFRQGDWAIFYYEFKLAEKIDVPICGVVIKNDRGIIVHGKNGLQYEGNALLDEEGTWVICRQEIKLDIAPGEYIFEIGLASVSNETWKRREFISHEAMPMLINRKCHLADAGSFSISLAVKDNISVLRHHGIADLPGRMSVRKVSQISDPTIFHVTHWKAGSQWINKILREAALDRIVQPLVGERQFLEMPIVNGGIYPTVYLTKEQFFSIALPERYRKFVVIRDLRDTLISAYYSIRYSHVLIDKQLVLWRNKLETMTVEQGLFMLLDEWLPMCAAIQKSWLESGEKCIRYEDLLSNDAKILEELLIDHCELPVDRGRLQEIIVENRFEALTGGRKPGDENKMVHERKGIVGDWRNHFTSDLTKEFNSRYSSLLMAGCYPIR